MSWLMGTKDGLAISLQSGRQAAQGRKQKLISILSIICQSFALVISWQAIFWWMASDTDWFISVQIRTC
ncbi:hypothetical protein Q5O_01560 [Pseudomonas putida JB]|nr:hypothetical protein Q5O_01560 [Pseudomonas putida JB]